MKVLGKEKVKMEVLKDERGFSVADLLVWGAVVGVMLTIIGIASIYFANWKEKQSLMSEYSIILTGLDTYRQDTLHYPAGSGWGWNTNNAYVPAEVVNRGWQYSCSGNTMTITTPAITNSKILTSVSNELSSKCDGISISGNSVVCQLNNRPCQ